MKILHVEYLHRKIFWLLSHLVMLGRKFHSRILLLWGLWRKSAALILFTLRANHVGHINHSIPRCSLFQLLVLDWLARATRNEKWDSGIETSKKQEHDLLSCSWPASLAEGTPQLLWTASPTLLLPSTNSDLAGAQQNDWSSVGPPSKPTAAVNKRDRFRFQGHVV